MFVKKRNIWFIGSYASGKTTQSRKIIENYSGMELEEGIHHESFYFDEKNIKRRVCTTQFDDVFMVGKVKPEVRTSGTDTLGTFKQVEDSYNLARENEESKNLVIDGAYFSRNWANFILHEEAETFLFVMDISFKKNLNRFLNRRREVKMETGKTRTFGKKTFNNIKAHHRRVETFIRKTDGLFDNKTNHLIIINAEKGVDEIHDKVDKHIRKKTVL